MKSQYTSRELRAAFIRSLPGAPFRRGPRGRILPQNDQPADIRIAWVQWKRGRLLCEWLAGATTIVGAIDRYAARKARRAA